MTKRILVTGKNSYVGNQLADWLNKEPEKYAVVKESVRDGKWKEIDFSVFDVVVHVAAKVHQKEKIEMREQYFIVNRDLTIEIAKKAKESGVSQFVFLSTMAVYGQEGSIGRETIIKHNTPINPRNYYGESKYEAEIELRKLSDNQFNVVTLRPPMVYGPNCPGNYKKLVKFAEKAPIFPLVNNKRSVVHINVLCQSIKGNIDSNANGLFFPQDNEYANTSEMVKVLAESNGKTIHLSKSMGLIIEMLGNRCELCKKAFGNLVYENENCE